MLVADEETVPIRGRRSGYVVGAAAALGISIFLAQVLRFGADHNIDWTFFSMFGPLFALALLTFLLVGIRAILPPELSSDRTGLLLRIGLRTSRWSWDQIEGFSLIRASSEHVAFSWLPTHGRKLKATWLNHAFPLTAMDLCNKLEGELNAARRSGTAAPRLNVSTVDMTAQDDLRYARRYRELAIVFWTSGGIAATWLISMFMRHTILLTQIDQNFQTTLVLLGACIGACLPITLIRLMNARDARPYPIKNTIILGLITGTAFISVFVGIGAASAWQITNAVTFFGTHMPLTQQYFRVQNFEDGRGGPQADIDPFGVGTTSLPISQADFGRLKALDQPGEASPLCYPALIQRSSDAVRMIAPGGRRPYRKILVPCPAGS